ncbi:hypothetical protein [Azospirillum brasilense]|uniref:Uncharacterized protein n=1 Tax=Azospirillum brasilense TaxID=192 RepID=A0A235H2M8_AZOBR|nr:hypothetical protein [Azospirillum brasilense]OYD80096.1 hypothetical protein CHT98_33005 [Azospirillum brasilense]
MPKIRLSIRNTGRWTSYDDLIENLRRYEAGELTEDCDWGFGFESWEHFASVLKTEAPGLADELADELLTMPNDDDRFAVFDTPAGQGILSQLWDRVTIDTSCPG